MDTAQALSTHYAILIGINSYPIKPLKGCVADIQNIQQYLSQSLNKSATIKTLIATENAYANPKTTALEGPGHPPTKGNVISALEEVIQLGKSGDFVYVHFSGHGTRASPVSEFSNRSVGDLALVLLDEEDSSGTTYLWGPDLAFFLHIMIQKKMQVTLVLDCCFAASVYRWNDPETRFLPYSSDINSRTTAASNGILASQGKSSNDRGVSLSSNWLMDPSGYTILAACGPDEEAREAKFDGQRHGALSFCLHRALNERGGFMQRNGEVLRYLQAIFRKMGLQGLQNPVLYGNTDLGFLRRPTAHVNSQDTVIILRPDESIEIQAGEAHGLVVGDQFLLHRFRSTESASASQTTIMAQVVHTKAFTSILTILEPKEAYPETGWVASPVLRHSLKRYAVELHANLPHRDVWLQFLQHQSRSVGVSSETLLPSFQVAVVDQEYRILDGTGQALSNIPPLPVDATDCQQVYQILEHLSLFKFVLEVSNATPEAEFILSFDIQITNQTTGERLVLNQLHHVKSDKSPKFTLDIENRGSTKLYIFIYNLGALWDIQNIYRGTYAVLPPRNEPAGLSGKFQKKLRLEVPQNVREGGESFFEDVIKVFITSEATSFNCLELAELGQLSNSQSIPRSPGAHRGQHLSAGNWATANFAIRTHL